MHFVLNYSVDELYDLVINNEKIPNDIIIEIAKIYNINTNQDMKYILSDLNVNGYFLSFEKEFIEYKKEEKERNRNRNFHGAYYLWMYFKLDCNFAINCFLCTIQY